MMKKKRLPGTKKLAYLGENSREQLMRMKCQAVISSWIMPLYIRFLSFKV
jgi:hypothetical protein